MKSLCGLLLLSIVTLGCSLVGILYYQGLINPDYAILYFSNGDLIENHLPLDKCSFVFKQTYNGSSNHICVNREILMTKSLFFREMLSDHNITIFEFENVESDDVDHILYLIKYDKLRDDYNVTRWEVLKYMGLFNFDNISLELVDTQISYLLSNMTSGKKLFNIDDLDLLNNVYVYSSKYKLNKTNNLILSMVSEWSYDGDNLRTLDLPHYYNFSTLLVDCYLYSKCRDYCYLY